MFCHHLEQSMNQPDNVANPARGKLNKGNFFFPATVCACEFGLARQVRPSRVSLLILHTQAESGAYSRDSSRFPRRRPYMHTANRYRASPAFIRSRNCVPTAFTAKSPPAQGQ